MGKAIRDAVADYAAIGERIALARKAAGLSQVDACKQGGIEKNTWNNWERGYSRPSVDNLAIIVSLLGVSFDWLLTGDTGKLSGESYTRLFSRSA